MLYPLFIYGFLVFNVIICLSTVISHFFSKTPATSAFFIKIVILLSLFQMAFI